MRSTRFTIEEQVGGLIVHDDHGGRTRRRDTPAPPTAEPPRYPLTRQGTAAIRAERASAPPARRQVA